MTAVIKRRNILIRDMVTQKSCKIGIRKRPRRRRRRRRGNSTSTIEAVVVVV